MKVIMAPDQYERDGKDISVFLAGGICGCANWQRDVIKELETYSDLDNLVVYNPRRDNFPIDDPNAAFEQIKWEFDHLQLMDIFSMFFCGGESDQPICMYELGRNLITMHTRFFRTWRDRIVITCDSGYKRKQDVQIQANLAIGDNDHVYFSADYTDLIKHHAMAIANAYYKITGRNLSGVHYEI